MTSPGSVLDAPLVEGHTTPRLFVKPLPANCDTSREDGCGCGCGLNPDTSWGFECIEFLQSVLGWVLYPWQCWLYVHALEKGSGGRGFRFKTIVILVSRQQGKTQWLKGLGIWRLYMDGAKQVLISAQNLEFAETTLAEAVADIKANRLLKREFVRFSQTNGKFRLILDGGRSWRAAVATRKGGRSLSVDLAELDELREHQNWLAWNAIVPTTAARPRSLVVCASNAGDKTSVVLRSLRDGALERISTGQTVDTAIGFFEWSIPDDADHLDRTFWPMAAPSMGHNPAVSMESIAAQAEAMRDNVAGFKTEYMCQWVDTLAPGIIPAEDWQATMDPESRRAPTAPVYAAVDVNFQRSVSYVAVAARRADGLLHIEVVKAERGTDWVLPWLTERAARFEAVAVQARGAPASGLIADMVSAGVPVLEWGGADLQKGFGDFYDLVKRHAVKHRPDPSLDTAAAGAQARYLQDALVIDRKNSPVDASPLVACVAAAWAEGRPPEEPEPEPRIFAWPDEEQIAEWENEQ